MSRLALAVASMPLCVQLHLLVPGPLWLDRLAFLLGLGIVLVLLSRAGAAAPALWAPCAIFLFFGALASIFDQTCLYRYTALLAQIVLVGIYLDRWEAWRYDSAAERDTAMVGVVFAALGAVLFLLVNMVFDPGLPAPGAQGATARVTGTAWIESGVMSFACWACLYMVRRPRRAGSG